MNGTEEELTNEHDTGSAGADAVQDTHEDDGGQRSGSNEGETGEADSQRNTSDKEDDRDIDITSGGRPSGVRRYNLRPG